MPRTLITQILRGVVIVGLLVVLGGIMLNGYQLYSRIDIAKEKLADTRAQVAEMEDENGRLLSDIDYFHDPDNLEKEARARFNYKGLGEQVWKIISGQ